MSNYFIDITMIDKVSYSIVQFNRYDQAFNSNPIKYQRDIKDYRDIFDVVTIFHR